MEMALMLITATINTRRNDIAKQINFQRAYAFSDSLGITLWSGRVPAVPLSSLKTVKDNLLSAIRTDGW